MDSVVFHSQGDFSDDSGLFGNSGFDLEFVLLVLGTELDVVVTLERSELPGRFTLKIFEGNSVAVIFLLLLTSELGQLILVLVLLSLQLCRRFFLRSS